MTTVMLVDDEPLAIQHLQALIPWRELGFEVVATASNGRRALQQFAAHSPEIIVSDIRMPVMDGLELCREIRQQRAQPVFILLSAYRDFDYAKQAIAYGVSNYILKHELTAEVLTAELDKARRQLSQQQGIELLLREQRYKRLLLTEDAKPDQAAHGRYLLAILQQDTPYVRGVHQRREGGARFDVLRPLLPGTAVSGMDYWIDLPIDEQHHAVLFREEGISSEQRQRSTALACVERLGDALNREPGRTISILYAVGVPEGQLRAAFRRLSGLSRCTVFQGRRSVFCLGEQPVETPDAPFSFDAELAQLESTENLEALLDTVFRRVMVPFWNYSELRNLCRALNRLAERQAEMRGVALPEAVDCWSVFEIERDYRELFDALLRQSNVRSGYSALIRQSLSYIDIHYHQDITLDELGAQCHMSGVYLGQLFKKEVGMTFLKYLTTLRMEQAKRLLLDRAYGVAQIAERVGYASGQYFSQIFQKYVGMTPNQYRKWGGERETVKHQEP